MSTTTISLQHITLAKKTHQTHFFECNKIKNNTKLSIQAFAGNGNATDGLSTAVYNKVKAASTPNGSEDVLLELEDFGEISAAQVLKLKSNESND